MGMYGNFRAIPEELINAFLISPFLANFFIGSVPMKYTSLEQYINSLESSQERQALKYKHDLLKSNCSMELINNLDYEIPVDYDQARNFIPLVIKAMQYPELSVEKNWQAIHFLINGTNEIGELPLEKFVYGSKPIGEEASYGPPRYLDHSEVQQVAIELNRISIDRIRESFLISNFNKNKIYPEFDDWQDSSIDSILHYYKELVAYYNNAAKIKYAMLMFIS